MSYTFISSTDRVIKVTENGAEIFYKKVYCSTSVDGNYFNFFAHELETGKLRQQYSLLYTDCTNPAVASAALLKVAVDALIDTYSGSGGGSLSDYTNSLLTMGG